MPVQPITSIPIQSPGFYGLNTADSPVGMSISFAAIADHCVIDNFGRIGSRQGFQTLTTNPETTYGDWPCQRAWQFVDITGVPWQFSAAGGKLWDNNMGSGVATELIGYSGNQDENNWQMVSLGDTAYFVQEFSKPHKFLPTDPDNVSLVDTAKGGSYPPPEIGYPSCACTGFGRLFMGGFENNKGLIVYSDLNEGQELSFVGTIDVNQYWPNGTDVVTAIEIHNDFLIVFGQRSILVYGNPNGIPDIYTIELIDTLSNIGCIARDSVAAVGTDLLFLDASGLRAFGRTVQEKSMPVGNLSANVKSDIEAAITESTPADIVGFYNPEDSLYTLSFAEQALTYAFDTKLPLDNGTLKTTVWTNRYIRCGFRSISGRTFYGGQGGLYEYKGNVDLTRIDFGNSVQGFPYVAPGAVVKYLPNGDIDAYPIRFRYWTHTQTFEAPSKLKFLKEIEVVVVGGAGAELFLKWRFNYSNPESSVGLTQIGEELYYYDGQEKQAIDTTAWKDAYESAKYSGGAGIVASKQLKVWGSGRVVAIGFEANVVSNHFSVQEMNIQSLLGRTI